MARDAKARRKVVNAMMRVNESMLRVEEMSVDPDVVSYKEFKAIGRLTDRLNTLTHQLRDGR